MIRRGKTCGAVLTLIALAACGGSEEPGRTAQAGGPGMGGPGGERIVTVEVQPVARGSIARQVTVSGTVEPLRLIGVNSQLAGALIAVNVQEGDHVEAGSVLARV